MFKRIVLSILLLVGLSPVANASYVERNSQYQHELGTCSLLADFPNFFLLNEQGQGAAIQNSMLNCQKRAIAAGAATFSNLHRPACMRWIPTSIRFGININTPLVVPRYVCLDPTTASFVRDGSSGSTPLSNWDGSPLTSQLSNIYQPMFIFPPTGLLTGDLVINLNRVGSDRGSGVFYGRTWRIATLAIPSGFGGTGFVGGESCSVANGEFYAPAAKATFTCAAATSGACTSITYAPTRWAAQTGQYLLPPYLQAQQWSIANGWDGNDVLRPQVFDNSGNYKTTCSGTGVNLAVTPTWWPDWCDGTNGCAATSIYDGAFSNFTPATGYLKSITAIQSGNSTSSAFGFTYGVWLSAFDVDFDFIQTQSAHFGTLLYGADIRGDTINDVGSFAGLKVASGGSIHVNKYIGDTSTDHYLEIDKVGNVSIAGSFLNTGSSITGAAAILIGADSSFSSSTQETRNLRLDFNMENAGSTAGIPAVSCQNIRNSLINLTVSNLNSAGSANAYQNNKFVNLGSNCEGSNIFLGSIDNIPNSITTGTDLGVGMHVWDGQAKAFALPRSTYNLVGSGAPTNGGSGTGLNKAGIGSTYTDYLNGKLYINSTASTSPTWAAFGTGSGANKVVFQLAGTLTIANDLTNWAVQQGTGTLTTCYAVAKTGPTGANLIFDIKKSTDNGATFTSVWASTPANRLKIVAGQAAGNVSAFDTTGFNAGDLYRIDVNQIGSGAAGANATVTCAVTLN